MVAVALARPLYVHILTFNFWPFMQSRVRKYICWASSLKTFLKHIASTLRCFSDENILTRLKLQIAHKIVFNLHLSGYEHVMKNIIQVEMKLAPRVGTKCFLISTDVDRSIKIVKIRANLECNPLGTKKILHCMINTFRIYFQKFYNTVKFGTFDRK